MRMLARLVTVSLIIGCGSSPPPAPPQPPRPAPPADAAAPDALTAAAFPGAPATHAGTQLAWVLDLLAHRKGDAPTAELEAHFAASFLAKVPLDQLASLAKQLAPVVANAAIKSVDGTDDKLVAHVVAGTEKLRFLLAIDPTSGKINSLLLQPDLEAGPKPTSFDDATRIAAAIAPRTQLLVAKLDKGKCVALHQASPTDELAIGSTFKLYNLLALADRVAAGKAKWTDEIAVRDDWKSLPSGVTQDDPAGTNVSLQTLAGRMISISDNTAADHVLYTVGRPAVEAAVRASKHAKPALDVPFLATRELFLLKLGDPAAADRYIAMNATQRRTYLDKDLAGQRPTLDGIDAWKGARHIDTLEWFASADDLCRVMAALQARGQTVLDILAKNPGLPVDAKTWPYVGFKGGSEPGVINMTYLLRRDDNAWFVMTLGFNAAEGGTVDQGRILGLATGMIELLAKER